MNSNNSNVGDSPKNAAFQRALGVFLQAVVVLVAVAALVILLWEPHLEGRNVDATLFEIYFKDPFLAYIYFAFISFFAMLCHAFVLFGYLGQGAMYSPNAVKALRTIKYCTLAFASLMAGAVAYIVIFQSGKDDIAGGVAVGVGIVVISLVTAIATFTFERRVQNTIVQATSE